MSFVLCKILNESAFNLFTMPYMIVIKFYHMFMKTQVVHKWIYKVFIGLRKPNIMIIMSGIF